jgi:hypothetical protein
MLKWRSLTRISFDGRGNVGKGDERGIEISSNPPNPPLIPPFSKGDRGGFKRRESNGDKGGLKRREIKGGRGDI